jgi:hypothetical protein
VVILVMSLLILIHNLVAILGLVVREVMGPLLHSAMEKTTIVVTKKMVNLQTMVLEMVGLLGAVHLGGAVVLPEAVHLVHQAVDLVGVVSLVVR